MELREQILELIIKTAAKNFQKNPSELDENTNFTDLQFKSANYVQITTTLEDEFEVEIPFMDFKRKKTFGEAADYVVELVEG